MPKQKRALLRSNANRGAVNILMAVLIFLIVATLSLGGLAIYYIKQYQTAQNTVDQQKTVAAKAAAEEQQKIDAAQFAERQKEPYRLYRAPAVLGSLDIKFPKTWNVFASEDQSDSSQLELYFNPEIVRSPDSYDGVYALRATLEQKLYTEAVADKQTDIDKGTLSAQPTTVSKIRGTRYNGQVTTDKPGVMVILPVRDKTLTIWTESFDFAADFEKILTQIKITP